MSTNTGAAIKFIVSIDDRSDADRGGDMGIFGRRDDERTIVDISGAVIRQSLEATISKLRDLFDGIDADDHGRSLPLKQAQVSFEITASGGIALLGTSAQAGSKGGITLTFGS